MLPVEYLCFWPFGGEHGGGERCREINFDMSRPGKQARLSEGHVAATREDCGFTSCAKKKKNNDGSSSSVPATSNVFSSTVMVDRVRRELVKCVVGPLLSDNDLNKPSRDLLR
jgi:hypothetical protein